MPYQGDLFGKDARLPAHRDVTAICEQCHREIQAVRHDPVTKRVYSEYRDALGRCFQCAFPKQGQ